MIKLCQVCLVPKDTDKKEVYPYEEDHIIGDPIDPLMELDVQPDLDPQGNPLGLWRRIEVCHECFHKLSPDMWISEEGLRRVGCKTAFTDLPLLENP
jgi:hypothetical protein